MSAHIVLNSRQAFILGASWVTSPGAPHRLIHIYLGPWLLTIRGNR
jgi:hypothetical protein